MKKKLVKFSLASILMLGSLVGCDSDNNDSAQVDAQKFRVTYDGNGGTGDGIVDLNQYESGTKVTVKENNFTAPAGKVFGYWSEEQDGSGSNHKAGSTFKIYEDTVLYAIWLDDDGGIIDPTDGDVTKEHSVRVTAPTGINYELSSNRALADTVITLTITLNDGVLLNGDPTSSEVTLTKKSDLVYTFVMPATSVNIKIKATMNGDAVITGDINAKLTDPDNDGIYTAEVDCTNPKYDFTYIVKDSEGSPTRLKSLALDETRCDANVTFLNGGENELTICGGATYIFAYDSNAAAGYNCFVTRKQINVLPSNPKTLYNLFDGMMRSQSTIHPQGLTSISYEKVVDGNDNEVGYKKTNEVYNYKKISDTESFAISKNKINNTDSYVYKSIDDTNNVYSIVNTYSVKEGNNEASDNVWGLDPYGDMQGDRYRDYSARQDIVDDSLYRDTTRYQITNREAYRNINMAAHYGSALEYEIWKAIRGDFDGSAAINAANAAGSHSSIVSTVTNDGFKVALNSQLEYNHIESGSTADVTQVYAFVYKADMEFLANGDLVSLDYTEKFYTESNWDFTNHKPLAAGVPITTTIKVTNGFDEIFTRAAVLGSFNPSDYFVSSINALKFYNPKAGAEDNTESVLNFDDEVLTYDYLGGEDQYKYCKTFDVTPSTALDKWQYGFISSTDKGVVDDTPYGPKAVGLGNCEITIGNHLVNVNGPTKTVKVNVYGQGDFHSLFVNANITGYDSHNTDNADYIYGYAGKTMHYYIDSSSNTGCPISYWMVIKAKDEFKETYYADSSEYFSVVNSVGTNHDSKRNLDFVKVVGHELILDFNTPAAMALTSEVQIDVIFASDFYATGYGPSTLHIVVGPAQKPLAGSTFECTFNYDGTSNIYEKATIQFGTNGTAKLTDTVYTTSGTVEAVNEFYFNYTEHANREVSCSITSVVIGEAGLPKTYYSYTMHIDIKQNGMIGLALYTDEGTLFGTVEEDADGYVEIINLTGFTRVAN